MNRQTHELLNRLERAGLTTPDALALRRCAMTLQRWHELECGTGEGQVSRSIERDEPDGRPYMRTQYPTQFGYADCRRPIPDRENGAVRRAGEIAARYGMTVYVQTDPRGAPLYLLRPGDVPTGESAESSYNRGIAVYR
jgi:hypothetical protein